MTAHNHALSLGPGATPNAPLPMQPLAGVTVIDFTQALAGPSATQVLGDFGANVLKIERPRTGDLSRSSTSEAGDDLDNPIFSSTNRNKRSICVDLRSKAGKAVIYELVSQADVVVNNFRPGVMERMGFSYSKLSDLNARIIYAVSTGFGTSGPYRHKGGQEVLAQGFTGVMMRRPDPEMPLSVYSTCYADFTTGMLLAQGILLALLARDRTGEGQVVETSLYDTLLALQLQEASMLRTRGQEVNWGEMPHTAVFSTADGAIVFTGAFKDRPLTEISRAVELDEDLYERAEFSSIELQKENRAQLHDILRKQFASNTTAYWIARLEAHDILCAEVRPLSAALNDPQTRHNDMLLDLKHANGSIVRTVASPVHLRGTPANVRYPVPSLGGDGEQILAEARYSRGEIDELKQAGVVQ